MINNYEIGRDTCKDSMPIQIIGFQSKFSRMKSHHY